MLELTVNDIYYMNKIGVYHILNTIDNKRYIGGAYVNFASRYKGIKNDWKKHHNSYLRNAAKKYGNEVFVYELIIECKSADETKIAEQSMLDTFIKNGLWKTLYNISEKSMGGNLGDEVNKKIGEISSARHADPAIKLRHSQNTKIALQDAQIRKKRKQDAIRTWQDNNIRKKRSKNISIGLMGRKLSEQTKKKISDAHFGKELTQQHKDNIRKSVLKAFSKPEVKEKLMKRRTRRIDIDKDKLIMLINNGLTVKQLAEYFNVSYVTICRHRARLRDNNVITLRKSRGGN